MVICQLGYISHHSFLINRSWGHSAILDGSSFLIFGGINAVANFNDIYLFDISTDRGLGPP